MIPSDLLTKLTVSWWEEEEENVDQGHGLGEWLVKHLGYRLGAYDNRLMRRCAVGLLHRMVTVAMGIVIVGRGG